MTRHARRDNALTDFLQANGLLQDKRSFVSQPLITMMQGDAAAQHLFLYGVDKIAMCQRVRKKENRCEICARKFELGDCAVIDHIRSGDVGRCDCRDNLRLVHSSCHKKRHVHTSFGESSNQKQANA